MNPYRQIPQIDKLLQDEAFAGCNTVLLTQAAREAIEALRSAIGRGEVTSVDREALIREILERYHAFLTPSLQPLVNATGITVHTNLGRSLIDPELFEEAKSVACNYCNLEYDLEAGRRGDRYHHTAEALRQLFGCEDALVVNNNAAAVYLILNTFAAGREAVVSRGELVEIGGSFRIPEVMKASGAILREVGTTNKTHCRDYEEAVGEETALLMKVHKSNYRIEGFSEEVPFADIRAVARTRGLLDYYDLGSAYLPDLPWGLSDYEPSIFRVLADDPSLISFSGDKLFGSVQAGIILGKKELIARLKKNQILRMFRVDKLTLALLERTVLAYRKGEYDKIPTLRMLREPIENLRERAERLNGMLPPIEAEVRESETYVGGGTMPGKKIPTVVLALEGDAVELERQFRARRIIGRIERDSFVLDMRTVREEELSLIAEAGKEIGG
ncbi:L-seryl-tRNA(Sec) selenium transferase [Nitratifractor salsuginis]|uniref:L-seryl-tRNA(Sec) selenium transferase n=1 Tax=Nitratifractor salsuginis (strain DSM 16511 / JCM 12458 / E9I37-1) TaxID=749222 RepID=E6X1T2_NITSE|nr:L-seryl-tRNA(Sec) selenium transferase [Nitratifractor salsuginis]ADV47073.1 L-seryl-tRNA(Sec) selenium transferase [Nitratifractor salsuginis DSM 16511]